VKFDIVGRLRNMGLPDGKTAVLYSVYEAVSNSVHAVVDKFGEDEAADEGQIEIGIELDGDGEVDRISVKDNGVGFTPENLASFETSDSTLKYSRGGKGVGRLIWFKTFENIEVESVYAQGSRSRKISFSFDPMLEESVQDLQKSAARDQASYTEIIISNLRESHGGRIRQASFMKDLALHFLPLYLADGLPQITLTYDGEERNLNEFIEEKILSRESRKVTADIDGAPQSLTFQHVFVDPTISKNLKNSYVLTAHGRVVGEPKSVAAKYALDQLPEGEAYVAVISGTFLDQRVDQERLSFRLTPSQRDSLEEAILAEIESFLADHITKVRAHQKTIVRDVLYEHPQLTSQISNLDDYVASIDPGMSDEKIIENLFVLLYREERKLREKVVEYAKTDSLSEEDKKDITAVLKDLSQQEKNRLAELVVKRHQILQTANLLLKYDNPEEAKYHYEKLVHELICPMGEMISGGDFDAHNLWILDESLAFSQLIASDKSITSLTTDKSSPKEPDIVFFNPLGFREEGSDNPITIVEFKRPGDQKPSADPLQQTLEYIEEFRNHRIKGIQGDTITDVRPDTPFEVFVVCELNEKTRTALKRGLAQTETPDGEGFYGYSKEHNASLHVVSFKKMVRDATTRNLAFFRALKLASPSTAAMKRAARRQAKKAAA
jgi:hypothetical protein